MFKESSTKSYVIKQEYIYIYIYTIKEVIRLAFVTTDLKRDHYTIGSSQT